MFRRIAIAALLVFLSSPSWSGEVLDSIVATVNGHPLLQSDLDDEVLFEAFMAARPISKVTDAERKAALGRLIDRELIEEQARPSELKPVDHAEVEKRMTELKTDYVHPDGKNTWTDALAAYGLTEDLVRTHIEAELNQLRVIDHHLRPSVQIDADQIRAYYEKELLPKLPAGKQISLANATPQIRELLVQQKINELLDSWLEGLRAQAEIERFDTVGSGGRTQ